MKKIRDDQLIVIDESGKETVCNILFTISSDDFNKNYVFYYEDVDLDEDSEKDIDILVASYEELEDGTIGELHEVETEEEWEFLSEVFDEFLEDGGDEHHHAE